MPRAKKSMSPQEAGRKGGETTAQKGSAFYREIGRKGGQARSENR